MEEAQQHPHQLFCITPACLRCAAEWIQTTAGCTKLPSFNFPGQTPASRCGTHREEGMVNVRHRVCQHEGEALCAPL